MSIRLNAICLPLMLVLAACGGGGGGGSTPTPPTPPPGDQPPTLSVIAPSGPEAEIPGGRIRVAFIANDDNDASVRAFLDTDGDPATQGDQTLLFTRGDQNGAPQMVLADLPGSLALGTTTLFLEANDNANPVVRSAGTPLLLYGGIAGVQSGRSNAYGVAGGVIVFSVGEAEDGGTILNNDGLADDGVMAYVDTSTLTLTQTASSADVTPFGTSGLPRILRDVQQTIAWDLLEIDEGRDLNGDLDLLDSFVMWSNPASALPPLLVPQGGMSLISTASTLSHFAKALEASASLDLNGDTDRLDDVFFIIDTMGTSVPYATTTPAANTPFVSASLTDRAAYFVDEAIQGNGNTPGIDLRGDGDTTDILLAVVDHMGGQLALAGFDPSLFPTQLPRNADNTAALAVSNEGWVGYIVDEALTGVGPINGDADATDFVPTIYQIDTMKEFVPGAGLNAGPGARAFFFDGPVAVFTASEEATTDRNLDGDTLDREVFYFSHAAASPTSATLLPSPVNTLAGIALDGGFAGSLAPGLIGIAANENANKDLNGDGDILDTVFLIVDARSSPPTVTNTGLVPLPTGAISGSTIPVTGVGGEDGVVIQVAETANGGDLNGDGDNSDTLLYFFAYSAPGQRVALKDTGAVHVANHGGRIAVTCVEGLTGQDFDGDGSALGYVLRVFDTQGSVLEPGRTSSPVSRPTSSDGQTWAWLRSEPAEGSDLNRDGDQVDTILGIWLD